jgi:outer membrane protein OmpA-like peptidoglycan-associated protein
MVFLAWRSASSGPSLAAAGHPIPSPTSTSSPTTTPTTAPTPTPTASTALPVIATAAPKSVPHVQAGQQLVLRSDVLFGLNSAALTPSATTSVTTLAKQISSSHVTGTIQINGYTDDLGSAARNLALSEARALAVAQVLQAGLAGQSVTLAPQGFGQASPVAPNTTDANRARNRRVTIVLPTPR